MFGYLGFLPSRGIAERSGMWVLVSIAVLLVYGGALYGLLPGRPGVSWLGHVCGFVAGVSAAWLMFPKGARMFGGPTG